ncbi:di-trans,poly-cis-decaprenylcistransferase [Candidatus Woesebacteria bacterium]|nr:di-trans,poly-cis-decaprenylcistransferase [Candidatus Woesebacteria bacterium]
MDSDKKLALPKGTVVPNHIAMVLDGNRRWARARGLDPWKGHLYGYKALEQLARASRNLGIHTFTVWTFSTENWERPKREVDQIMNIFRKALKETEKDFHREKVALIHLGRKDRLPSDIRSELARFERETARYAKNHIFNVAVDYGGKDEIVRAARRIVAEGVPVEKIDEKLFESYLDTHNQPYPYIDLFIRTSAEQRTSGFLPWQMSYAEYLWEPDHLPDMTPAKLRDAILDFSRRRRRFGGDDQLAHFKFKPELAAKLELAWWRLANIPEGERFRDYAIRHLKEQFGLSASLAKEAAVYMTEAVLQGKTNKWGKAKNSLRKFYKLVKEEVKLAFEPSIVASLEVKLLKEIGEKQSPEESYDAESTAREFYAEVYRISLLQAAKLAHLRVLAAVERNLALAGMGEHHWDRAEDYLQKFYRELKDRVA